MLAPLAYVAMPPAAHSIGTPESVATYIPDSRPRGDPLLPSEGVSEGLGTLEGRNSRLIRGTRSLVEENVAKLDLWRLYVQIATLYADAII